MKREYIEEIWKPVKGYEGLYEVSNYGRVRSLDYGRTGKIRVLKPGLDGHGYLKVCLSIGGKHKTLFIHRLVAIAFIPNPNNYPIINHRDCNPLNNHVDNLEWCSYGYNNTYGFARELRALKTVNHPNKSHCVCQFNKDGTLIKEYPSAAEATRQTGISNSSILDCCINRVRRNKNGSTYQVKSAGGFIWKFKEKGDAA